MKFIANNYEPKEILKFIRQWSEKTQDQFGKSIGKSKDTIQSWELGRTKISLNTFMEIAKKENIIITIERK